MRPARSRDVIRATFLELLGEMPAHKITVSKLVSRAGVNRSTFYRNYAVLDDVLDDIFDQVESETDRILSDNAGEERLRERIMGPLLRYRERAAWLRTILNSEKAPLLEARMEREVAKRLQVGALSGEVVREIPASLYASFFTAGITRMMCEWIRTGCTEDIDDVAHYIMVAVRTINTVE